MSNTYKAIIALVAIAILTGGSMIYLNSQNRPADKSAVISSSSSTQVSSVSNLNSSSSSSSVLYSSSQSQSEIAKVVETQKSLEPKMETPKVVAPVYNPPIAQTPKGQVPSRSTATQPSNTTYTFNYELFQFGGLPLSNFDIGFLNENIGDIADYYYNSVRSQYPNQNIFVNSFGVQKQDDVNYLIRFHTAFTITSPKTKAPEQFNNQVFLFTKINQHDGNFQLTNLQDFNYETTNPNVNYPTDLIEFPIYTDGDSNSR